MFKTTLIQFLTHLNRKEMTRFVEFVDSPFFNKHKDVKRLVHFLNKIYPNFTKKKTDRLAIYAKMFPKEAFDEPKLKHVFSYTLRLLEQFLSHQEFMKVDSDLKLFLLRDLRNRNLNKRFEKILAQTKSEINKEQIRNFSHHSRMYTLISEADKYFTDKEAYKRDENLQNKVDSLDRFYLSEKLRSICEMLNRKRFLDHQYDFNMEQEMISYLEARPEWWANTPSIQIYYQVYQTLRNTEEDKHYYKLMDLLQDHRHKFPETERLGLFNYALNYCIRRGNSGRVEFWKEVFKIYKQILKDQLILENGFLSESHYGNIATVAMKVKEFDWAENFIHEYKNQLSAANSENAFNYNLSRYYVESRQYDEALVLLNSIEYTNLVYFLGCKVLLLRAYYELGEGEPLRSLMDSFKQYLTRNKLLNKTKIKRYSDHFRLTGRLYKLKIDFAFTPRKQWIKDVQKLEQKVDETKVLPGKVWIKAKLKELLEMGGIVGPSDVVAKS